MKAELEALELGDDHVLWGENLEDVISSYSHFTTSRIKAVFNDSSEL